MREREESARFLGHILEVDKATTFANHVEQIAMLARRRGIGPFAGRTFRRILQPHEHRAARRVAHIPDLPVIALTASGRQIVTAHRLGLPAKTGVQVSAAL